MANPVSLWESFDHQMMGMMRAAGRVNHPTRVFTDQLIQQEFADRYFRWLEIGLVGMVDYERLVGKLHFTFMGFDRSPAIVEDSKHYLKTGDMVAVWNIEDPIPEGVTGPFDLITIRHVLQHCQSYERPIARLAQLLAERGLCVITLGLPLVDGDDQLSSQPSQLMNGRCVEGEYLENRYNKDRFLRCLAQHFQIERFIRFEGGHNPNDLFVVRKTRQKRAIPRMERVRPSLLRWAARRVPPELKRFVKRLPSSWLKRERMNRS